MNILELFDKYLELVQEHETWIEYKCPICNHSGLKIKKENEYYKNFKCNCDIKRISSYILSKSGQKIERKPRERPVLVPEIPNVLGVKLSPIEYGLSLSILESEYNNPQAKIYYSYSETQRTIRINKTKSTGKKIIFPQVLCTGSWVNGIGDNLFLIYTDRYSVKEIEEKLVLQVTRESLIGELIVVVEGEKCVQYLQSYGIEAICILNSYTNSIDKVKLVLEANKSLIPNVKQFLYIPDLDKVGMDKAIKFQQASWSLGIPCKVFDIRGKLLKTSNFESGYDIADYISENKDVNLVSIFEDEFRHSNQ